MMTEDRAVQDEKTARWIAQNVVEETTTSLCFWSDEYEILPLLKAAIRVLELREISMVQDISYGSDDQGSWLHVYLMGERGARMIDIPGWDRQTRPEPGQAGGWIQWKGTDVCMDFHCKCGFSGHIDGMFVYYVRCPECKTVYMANGNIEMVELTTEETVEAMRLPTVVTVERDP